MIAAQNKTKSALISIFCAFIPKTTQIIPAALAVAALMYKTFMGFFNL